MVNLGHVTHRLTTITTLEFKPTRCTPCYPPLYEKKTLWCYESFNKEYYSVFYSLIPCWFQACWCLVSLLL